MMESRHSSIYRTFTYLYPIVETNCSSVLSVHEVFYIHQFFKVIQDDDNNNNNSDQLKGKN